MHSDCRQTLASELHNGLQSGGHYDTKLGLARRVCIVFAMRLCPPGPPWKLCPQDAGATVRGRHRARMSCRALVRARHDVRAPCVPAACAGKKSLWYSRRSFVCSLHINTMSMRAVRCIAAAPRRGGRVVVRVRAGFEGVGPLPLRASAGRADARSRRTPPIVATLHWSMVVPERGSRRFRAKHGRYHAQCRSAPNAEAPLVSPAGLPDVCH